MIAAWILSVYTSSKKLIEEKRNCLCSSSGNIGYVVMFIYSEYTVIDNAVNWHI